MSEIPPLSYFVCSQCDTQITRVLREAASAPDLSAETYGTSTIPRGFVWTDISFQCGASPKGAFLVPHPVTLALRPIGDRNGCCGPSGLDGVNIACPIGHAVGTEVADCFTPHFLVLHPELVRRIPSTRSETVELSFGRGRTCTDVHEFYGWLHTHLASEGWYGEDIEELLLHWSRSVPKPHDILWFGADESEELGLPMDKLMSTFSKYPHLIRLIWS